MRLISVNGLDPSGWSHAQILEKVRDPLAAEHGRDVCLVFEPAPHSSVTRAFRDHAKPRAVRIHIPRSETETPIGIELAPARSRDLPRGRSRARTQIEGPRSGGWLVKSVPGRKDGKVRRGMRLCSVNGEDPSSWSIKHLIARMGKRPLDLAFLPAPRSVTTHRLLSMSRTLQLVLTEPSDTLSIELAPRHDKGWIVKRGNSSGTLPLHGSSHTNQIRIRRGMTLLSVDGQDPSNWPRAMLLDKMRKRPLRVEFKPAPRSNASRRLRSSRRHIKIVLPSRRAASNANAAPPTLGIELCERRRDSPNQGCLVKRSKHPRIRKGMTLVAVGQVDVRRSGHSLAGVTALIRNSGRPLTLHFEAAPVSSRSLSPETADRRRQMPNARLGQQTRLVKMIIPSDLGQTTGSDRKGNRVGLHLHPRTRGGVMLKRIDEDLASKLEKEQGVVLRRGFTLLSIAGKDVSVNKLDQVTALLKEKLSGHAPVELTWRPPPVHTRSLSPVARGSDLGPPPPSTQVLHPAAPPAPDKFQDVVRVAVDINALPLTQGREADSRAISGETMARSLGLELAPRRHAKGVLVKNVRDWSFYNTEIRRGMQLLRIGRADVEDMPFESVVEMLRDAVRPSHRNHEVVLLFRGAPAASLTPSTRRKLVARAKTEVFETTFVPSASSATGLGLHLVPSKRYASGVLLSKCTSPDRPNTVELAQGTNLRQLRRGCRLLRVNGKNVSEAKTLAEVMVLLEEASWPKRLIWCTPPPTSLSASILRSTASTTSRARYGSQWRRRTNGGVRVATSSFKSVAGSVAGYSLDSALRNVMDMLSTRRQDAIVRISRELVSTSIASAVSIRCQDMAARVTEPVSPAYLSTSPHTNQGTERVPASTRKLVPSDILPGLHSTPSANRTGMNNLRQPSKESAAHYLLKSRRVARHEKKPRAHRKVKSRTGIAGAKKEKKKRTCITMLKSEHDPDNGIYWIGSVDSSTVQDDPQQIESSNQKQQPLKQRHTSNGTNSLWAKKVILSKRMLAKSGERKKAKENKIARRKRTGALLPVLTTLSSEHQKQLNRLNVAKSGQNPDYAREVEEADRLIRRSYKKWESDGMRGPYDIQSAPPRKKSGKNGHVDETISATVIGDSHIQSKAMDLEYYRITKGVPLYTGGVLKSRNNIKRRRSGSDKTVLSGSDTTTLTNDEIKKDRNRRPMSAAHRDLLAHTALHTLPKQYRMQYKPEFVKLLWQRAISLLDDAFEKMTTVRLRRGIDRWRKEARRRTRRRRHASAIVIQCAIRSYQARCELQERLRVKREREERRRWIAAVHESGALRVQCWWRGEVCRISLHWMGRDWKRATAREAAVFIQRFYRGAAAFVLQASLELLHRRRDRASCLIQRVYRGHLGRRHAKLLGRIRNVEVAAQLQVEARLVWSKRHRVMGAATTIRNWWLEEMRKQRMRIRTRLRQNKKAFLIQRWLRGCLGRIEFKRALYGAQGERLRFLKLQSTIIQTAARGKLARMLLTRMKFVSHVYTRERQDRSRRKKRWESRTVMRIARIPLLAKHMAYKHGTPFAYGARWRAAVKIQAFWRRIYYTLRYHALKRLTVRLRRRRIRYYAIRAQARIRGHQTRTRLTKAGKTQAAVRIQAVWRSFWSRRRAGLIEAAKYVQAIWRGRAALRDYNLQATTCGDGPLVEARNKLWRMIHTAFHGPARIFLARRKVKRKRDAARFRIECRIAGEREYNNTFQRRQLWRVRESMRRGSKTKARSGGLGGSNLGDSVVEKVFRLLCNRTLNRRSRKSRSTASSNASPSVVLNLREFKRFLQPLRSRHFLVCNVANERDMKRKGKARRLKKILPSDTAQQREIEIDLAFAKSKSRGDGLLFPDFVMALANVAVLLLPESLAIGARGLEGMHLTNNGGRLGLRRENLRKRLNIWSEEIDEHSGRAYYWNEETEMSEWTAPRGWRAYKKLLLLDRKKEKLLKENQKKRNLSALDYQSPKRHRSDMHNLNLHALDPEIAKELTLDNAATVFILTLLLSKSSSDAHIAVGTSSSSSFNEHRKYRSIVRQEALSEINFFVNRIQRRYRGRPSLLSVMLEAAWAAKIAHWEDQERSWAALVIQSRVRRHFARKEAQLRASRRWFKFQVVEHAPAERPPPKPTSGADFWFPKFKEWWEVEEEERLRERYHLKGKGVFWYDRGPPKNLKANFYDLPVVGGKKTWQIPKILCTIGDVPTVPVDTDTVNPLCEFCVDEHSQIQANSWWEQGEGMEDGMVRRQATLRCENCAEVYCGPCHARTHDKGNLQKHITTPLETCERCHMLLASVECFDCAAHPGWRAFVDKDSGGRVFYHNPLIGPKKGGSRDWQRPFGFGGSAKLCHACHRFTHPSSKFRVVKQRWDQPVGSTGNAAGFLAQRRNKQRRLREAELQAKGLYDKHEVEARRKAKRPIHHFKPIVQVCEECERRPALWSCEICGHYCGKCLNKTHSKGNRAGHSVTEFIVLTRGPGWERDMAEAEKRRREAEIDRRLRMTEAIHKVDLLKAVRCVQRHFRRKKERKSRDRERRRRELRRRDKAAQARQDAEVRISWQYRIKSGLGSAPILPSDKGKRSEAMLRQQVWRQSSVMQKGRTMINKARRGVGADARLPGLVKVRNGDDVAYTTEDLTHLLKRGDCIRIGPIETFRIPGGNNEKVSADDPDEASFSALGDEDDEGSVAVDPRTASRPRPFTKHVIPLNEWWYGEDATLHVYFVQANAPMAQWPPETGVQEIDFRARAWNLKQNPPKPTEEQLAAAAKHQEEKQLKAAGAGAESEKKKAERLRREKAVMEARLTKMKNRRSLRVGGKNARKNKMKSLKRAKSARAKAVADAENARQAYMRGNSDDEDND